MPNITTLAAHWIHCQFEIFPRLEDNLGSLPGRYRKLYLSLEAIDLEAFLPSPRRNRLGGRPQSPPTFLARAFLAKMIFNLSTTSGLREHLIADQKLRSLCGWASAQEVPSESTFSRAFAEFAAMQLPERIHEELIKKEYKGKLVFHISRDSTSIDAREKPVKKKKEETKEEDVPKRGPGRPKKGEEPPPKEPKRLERQRTMGIKEMQEDLPKDCTVGCKRNSKGHTHSWVGFKLHVDAADGHIPISGLVTSASLHDSQAAIPLAAMTSERVNNLYDLMDSAYDAGHIHEHSEDLGHRPIIDKNPRSKKAEHSRENKAQAHAGLELPERVRYRERSNVERLFGRLKDEFGARNLRVRGHQKVTCHLMFGILALTLDQLMRLTL